ncbi:MAG: hypothetical protein IPJ13_02030 [Saprospiraceae bacterium]|nr:hypothetical protein [Saprospiraceae bacterium]
MNPTLIDNMNFEFDVFLSNTGSTTLKVGGFTGGKQYVTGTLPNLAAGTLPNHGYWYIYCHKSAIR